MRISCLVWLAAVGCSVDVEVTSVAFLSPAPGATYERATLGETGALVAAVPVELALGGDMARVTLVAGDHELGDLDLGAGALTAQLRALGATMLTAIARDELGTELVSATVDITVLEPEVADCRGWLDLYQLDYTVGPDRMGVADPITVKTPLNGVRIRYNGSDEPRETLFGDCTLIKSLADGASIMREAAIAELVDIGVYNYRCIDQSKTPPNCNMSQHAYAKAIDIAGFEATDGTYYSVNDDWVIDPDDDTCTAATEPGKDSFLHDVICALKDADVWNIVLTPNYNSAHRNHFHVDLTEGSDFIERLVAEGPSFFERFAPAAYGD